MPKVLSLVLGGGRGTRLYPLTKYRAKPAVPLAGKYRLIDIPLSNCINSGLNRIYVLTQFLSVSLHRHIRQTYRFDPFSGGFVELLAAQQTIEAGTDWYQGTSDAVRKNVRYLQQPGIEHVLILSGDQLYRMNFQDMIKTHEESHADATIAALPVTASQAGGLGIMRVDQSGRVIGFVEKPQTEEQLAPVRMGADWLKARGIEAQGRDCLASMGIYLFRRDVLVELMNTTEHQDFGREVFPRSIDSKHVQAHLFDGYWEDIGTIKAFYDANLSLTLPNPPFALASAQAPVYSRPRYLPPTRIDGASVKSSLIADGCEIGHDAIIENSVIGLRCMIGPGAVIRNSVLMGADYYEGGLELDDDESSGKPRMGIGANTVIEGAIVDKNCHIGSEVRIVNEAGLVASQRDREDCMVRDGVPVVLKGAVLRDGWELKREVS
jgi:glucose-1-phosphate adenylyltransferase